MAKKHLLVGLDIGTDKIKILAANKESGREELEILSQLREESSGIRRGVVVDVEGVSQILKRSFSQLEGEIGQKIDSVYVNLNGAHLFSLSSRGTVAVSRADQKISEEDIQRVLQAAQTINLPSNKEIFEAFPQEFIIDGEGGIKEPLGLEGVRLEAEVLVLGGFAPYLKNLTQAVLNSGVQILDMIPSPIAAARAILTPKQKELGVGLLDIGAGTSGLAVFEEGNLCHLAILPMGSANITNDIAIGLKIDTEIAERIKIEYGSCLSKGKKKEKIKIGEGEPLIFSQRTLAEIIEARVSEIFREANKELKKISREKLLPAGIVLTGGGALLPQIVELAKREFKLPAKIGKPKEFLDGDPTFAVSLGLILTGADLEEKREGSGLEDFGKRIGSKIKKIFKIFIP